MSPELFGWISTLCLSMCGVPQMIKVLREGHARGVSHGFLWLWETGEWFQLFYCLSLPKTPVPLVANITFNLLVMCPIIYRKYWERGKA